MDSTLFNKLKVLSVDSSFGTVELTNSERRAKRRQLLCQQPESCQLRPVPVSVAPAAAIKCRGFRASDAFYRGCHVAEGLSEYLAGLLISWNAAVNAVHGRRQEPYEVHKNAQIGLTEHVKESAGVRSVHCYLDGTDWHLQGRPTIAC